MAFSEATPQAEVQPGKTARILAILSRGDLQLQDLLRRKQEQEMLVWLREG